MSWIRRFVDRFFGSAAAPEDDTQAPLPEPSCLIVGLGNPGPEYLDTRHNVGFRVIERLAEMGGAQWQTDAELSARVASIEMANRTCLLIAPQTFMNRSGAAVSAALERWPGLDSETDVIVVYDDMDLPTGRIRLRPSGGAGGHRGIGDIIDALGTKAIARLRFGVGHPGPDGPSVIDWVLAPFPESEIVTLDEATARAAEALETSIAEGVSVAMGRFNGSG
jgi:PTH1 family peptidyl-tRNA hydrolase